MKIAFLSNVNLDLLASKLSPSYERYVPPGFDTWVQELIDPQSGLSAFSPAVIFFLLDGDSLLQSISPQDRLADQIQRFWGYIDSYRQRFSECIFIISNLDVFALDQLNFDQDRRSHLLEQAWESALAEYVNVHPHSYLFDLKRIVHAMGQEQFYDTKMWYLGGIRYSLKANLRLIKELDSLIKAIHYPRKKCLVLDLDNTLWGGVLSEDGLEGLVLSASNTGRIYKDFQRLIHSIKSSGVVLTIVSKNSQDEVERAFKLHPHMVLSLADIVLIKANWLDKSKNIADIATELNFSFEDMVFVDDNPLERAEVKSALPMVIVPDFPEDISSLPLWGQSLFEAYFFSPKLTAEDQSKTLYYKQNHDRLSAQRDSVSVETFLKQLNTVITIRDAKESDLDRVHQLLQKTNQFNCTTLRYSLRDLSLMLKNDDMQVKVFSVSDCFGDNGMVGVVILRRLDAHTMLIDTFLMSCRVMGRTIEDQVLTYLEKYLYDLNIHYINGKYIRTVKNIPVEYFYDRMGYALVAENVEGKDYQLALPAANARPDYGTVISA